MLEKNAKAKAYDICRKYNSDKTVLSHLVSELGWTIEYAKKWFYTDDSKQEMYHYR